MDRKPVILVVDDEPLSAKLLEAQLVPLGYQVLTALSGEEAMAKIADDAVDIVLLDIMMPEIDGLEVCRRVKAKEEYQSLPIILVTALDQSTHKVTGFEAGADDFLTKPVDKAELMARIRAHLRIKSLIDEIESWNKTLEGKVRERTRVIEEKNRELAESYHLTLDALVRSLDVREHETGNHSLRVACYTVEMAKIAGVQGMELEEIAMGALLHDIGKVGISDAILLKPGKLTWEEWVEMRKHPEIGWQMIKDIEFIGQGRKIPLEHQERFDGKGYPRHLKGDEIYIGARLFSVVDTMDAMTSDRPYRKALPFEAAEKEIGACSGSQLDPKAVEIFLSISKERWIELRRSVEGKDFRTLIREIKR